MHIVVSLLADHNDSLGYIIDLGIKLLDPKICSFLLPSSFAFLHSMLGLGLGFFDIFRPKPGPSPSLGRARPLWPKAQESPSLGRA